MREKPPIKRHKSDTRSKSMRLKKVVLIIGQLGRGGTEKQIVLLAQGLHDRGIDTAVWTLFDGGPYETVLRRSGIRVVRVQLLRSRTIASVFANIAGLGSMLIRMRRENPDVVHAFLFHANAVAALITRLGNVPVFVAGRRNLTGILDRRAAVRLTARLISRLAANSTDLVIANAAAVADDAKQHDRLPDDKVQIVYNGLSEQAFAVARAAVIDTANPVVLYIANLWRYKGHRYLLNAASLLQQEACPCTLLLVGDGKERQVLEQQAAALGVDARFLGERDDIPHLLARADVVAHPSLQEGMSNALMEAMAAGRAIVATSVGGTPELLDGRGLLVPPADAAALADGIRQLLSDRCLAARFAADARIWALDHLSASAMIEKHIQIYSRLLEC
jgi:L-malate glycosyltransferase